MKCKICGNEYTRRRHKVITPKLVKKPYFYTEWDFCERCGRIQHYERYKVKVSDRFHQETLF